MHMVTIALLVHSPSGVDGTERKNICSRDARYELQEETAIRCRVNCVTYQITCKGCGEPYMGEMSQNT